MKLMLIALALTFSSFAYAKTNTAATYTPQTLSDGNWSGQNHLYFSVIPYANGTGFGLGYEKSLGNNLGVGGGLTFLPDKDDAKYPAAGLIALGANVRLHFPVQYFDFYIAPGLNIMMIEAGPEDETTIGASVATGCLAQFNRSFALGIEMSVFHPWFNKDVYALSRMYFFNTGITARLTF